jgi:hypothetical protein
MVNYENFNLDSFQFRDEAETKWNRRFEQSLKTIFRPRIVFERSPVRSRKNPAKIPTLNKLAESVGLYKPELKSIFSFHQERLRLWNFVTLLVYELFGLALFGALFVGIRILLRTLKPLILSAKLEDRISPATLEIAILFTVALFSMAIIIRVAIRLAFTLTTKNFAESLCVRIIIYIVLDLSRNDVLTNPKKRRTFILRVDDLARVTRLLSARYASRNEVNQQWIKRHFSQLERGLLERARWAVAPAESTLQDLREDFYKLAIMYIDGTYGTFSWGREQDKSERSFNWKRRLIRGASTVVGVAGPVILMILLLRHPASLEPVGISANIIALVLIAWFLFAVDAVLKLGVVAGVVNLAKEVKNLK